MVDRPCSLGTYLSLFCLAVSTTAFAGEASLVARQQHADALASKAQALRKNAAARYDASAAECRKRIFVNDCLDKAHEERLGDILEARLIEAEHAALTREIRRKAVAERRSERLRQHREADPAALNFAPAQAE